MNSLPKEWIVLAGNPNTGKTAIFNLLTGLHQKVSNYPGITVEKKFGIIDLLDEKSIHILDLPGSYSLTSETFDEHVVSDEIFSWIRGENKPNLILSVVDVENLSRNLYFTSQLLDIGIPVIVVLNMMDQIQKSTLPVSVEQLKERLGAIDVVPVSAIENQGIDRLKDSIITNLNSPMKPNDKDIPFEITGILRSAIRPLFQFFTEEMKYSSRFAWAQSVRIISRKEVIKFYESGNSDNFSLNKEKLIEFKKIHSDVQKNLNRNTQDLSTLEPQLRYRWIDGILRKKENLVDLSRKSKSEKADKILTHKLWGPFIFIGILYLIFQSVFSWAVLPMNWVNNTVAKFGNWVYTAMPEHIIRDLVVEGVIGGVGAVLVFMPQIIFLVLFMAIMEDTGYMARIAFMMDRLMSKVGLHGRSVLPLMTGYACAIPGIMATRTIVSWKERLVTILILPLMSCSARLPVYALMIGAFIPPVRFFGIIDAQGLTMVMMYFLGTVTALILAVIFSRWIKMQGKSTFIMEMPPYRIPLMRSVFRQVYLRVKQFVTDAGKIILVISVVLWILASFPKIDNSQNINTSYAGKIGKVIEPIIRPLGFDWKIGLGLLTSFAAREVLVSTMATIYNVESDDENVIRLTDALQQDKNPDTGKPAYTVLTGISIMVFFVFAAQCMATFAVVRRETNTWRWPLFMIFYMTGLAYIMSFIVYQGGLFLGFG
ncbi:MAG: ferrous iron transport protein B [Candidatus Marinimicrobia bacterium]|jgi:ferrous iron transport protein B|nr:ferrous iron transport protein B [Candidatus Neomarinimicrobiota bacterium]|tara:strand:+ start:6405 stop:8537 length:2133 start_codon:yes stop_codon:yes gene_type:complete